MVSQIEQELATACEFEILTGRTLREEAEFKVAVVNKVNGFPDDTFDALSEEAQEWIELAIDRQNQPPPPHPLIFHPQRRLL